ncbi:hypothetical protein D3C72_2116980 [compost metagenome]
MTPESIRATASALDAPVAIKSTLGAESKVPTPMVRPCGAISFEGEASSTKCVEAESVGAGSLKAMWPFAPRPKSVRFNPPASAIASS